MHSLRQLILKGEARLIFLGMVWVWQFRRVFLSGTDFLPRDSFYIDFLTFDYICQHLKWVGSFPDWDFRYGMSLVPFGNNHLILAPYRWVGYLLAIAGVPTPIAYKFCFLFVGQGLFLFGVYLFHQTLTRDQRAGLLAVLLCLISSVSFSLFHQEQVLATLFFIPYIGWALLKARIEPKYLLLAGACFGMALNSHYPQLLFIFFGLMLPWVGRTLKRMETVWAGGIAILCAAPVFYAYVHFHDDLKSTFRDQTHSIVAQTYEEYERFNRMGPSSVPPKSFALFLRGRYTPPHGEVGDLDDLSFHATLAFPLLLVICFFLPLPFRLFYLCSLGGLALCAMGIYGPAPRTLWSIIPGLKLFRQWYHFIPLFTLMAVSWTAVAIIHLWRTKHSLLGNALFALALLSGLSQTWWATSRIESRLIPKTESPPASRSADEFYRRAFLEYPLTSPLAIPKSITLPTSEVLSKRAIPFWRDTKGNTSPADPKDLQFIAKKEGVLIKSLNAPMGSQELTLLQFDDDRWRMPRLPRRDRLVTLATDHLSRGVHLTREKSNWWMAIAFSWIFFLSTLFYTLSSFYRHSKFSRSFASQRPHLPPRDDTPHTSEDAAVLPVAGRL